MHICEAIALKFLTASTLIFASQNSLTEEILVRTQTGSSLTVEIDPNDSFSNVMSSIEMQINEVEGPSSEKFCCPVVFDYLAPVQCANTYRSAKVQRIYANSVTSEEKKDIRYLLTNMATSSWTQLLSNRSSMNKAGDRVDHVHPLRFVQCIFSDEELKGCLHSIRDRSIIWKKFFSGLSESLQDESDNNNMRPEFIQDFAASLGLDPSIIYGSIQAQKWTDFIDILLAKLPRSGNPGRYDM